LAGWTWLALVGLFLAGTRGFVYRIRLGVGGVSGSLLDDRVSNAIFYVVYGLIATMFATRSRDLRQLAVVAPLAVVVGVLCASTAWSIEWSRTLNQSLLMALGTLAVALVVTTARPLDVIGSLFAAAQVVVGLSVLARAREWQFSIDRHGNLTGFVYNRNALGLVAVLGVATGVILACRMRSTRWVFPIAAVVIVDAAVWWRTGSATPVVALVVAALVAGWIAAWQRRVVARSPLVVVAVVVILACFAGLFARAPLAEMFGRDSTFTGRTSTWNLVVDAWWQRPWHGFGFMAGWFDGDLRRGLAEIGFNHWEAHNGYLEVLLGAGLLGASALAWFLVRLIGGLARAIDDSWAPWLGAATTFALVLNVSETQVGPHRSGWFLLVATAVQIASSAGRRQPR